MTKKKPLSPDQLSECARLKALFLAKKNRLHLSQNKIAEAAGMSTPAIAMYLNGTNALNARIAAVFSEQLQEPVSAFSTRLAEEIARMAGTTTDSKKSEPAGSGDRESNVISADFSQRGRLRDGDLQIPQFDVRAAMGGGQLPADYIEVIRYVTMHKSHLEMLGITYSSPENLAIMTGWGQSMKGTINHGEPVFVDRGITSFIGDGVYAFTWDGLLYLKRLQKESKTHFRVISDNQLHQSFSVPIEEVIIHARALLAWNANKL